MELYTMNSRYSLLLEVDYFSTLIWTERFHGDSDFQVSLAATPDNIRKFSIGTRIGLLGSTEVMIVDKQTIKNRLLTVVGTSLTQKLNNRFIRFTNGRKDKDHTLEGSPGWMLQNLVYNFATDSDYLSGAFDHMGISDPARLIIPDLSLGDYDSTLDSVNIGIPYGPLFDALKTIAQTYNLGQRIERWGVADIRYTNWLGIDHTSTGPNALVRFSLEENNLGDISEVLDGSKFKTHAFVFADQLLDTETGEDSVEGEYVGFDLRADMVFASDITSDANLSDVLNERAYRALQGSTIVGAVDGTVVPGGQYKYGINYGLGDVVEVQGTSGLTQPSRVTEYIRAQDAAGERAYPTLVSV